LLVVSAYHAVLAVNDKRGERARRLRRSSILDRCARRDGREAGNPAQDSRSFNMPFESTTSGTLYVRDRADYRPATPQEVITAARGVLSRRFRRGSSLDSPGAVRDYLRVALAELEHEVFCMIALDLCGVFDYVQHQLEWPDLLGVSTRRTQHIQRRIRGGVRRKRPNVPSHRRCGFARMRAAYNEVRGSSSNVERGDGSRCCLPGESGLIVRSAAARSIGRG